MTKKMMVAIHRNYRCDYFYNKIIFPPSFVLVRVVRGRILLFPVRGKFSSLFTRQAEKFIRVFPELRGKSFFVHVEHVRHETGG